MQLWQFLYSMLTDPDGKYKNLIEWTQTAKERQFRLLEPDAIAVWWGHHKNKPNMSYDKLSRSLRYYYDKGIIRKISGERFVYRFCIDPEVMYKHMGTSHSRPKLKPMPQDAKVSLGKNHNMANASHGIAKEPESLVLMKASSQMPPILPPPYPTTSYSHTIATTNSYSAPILCMRRSHSYDSTYQHTNTTPESSPTPCPSSFPTFYKSNSNSPPLASPPQSMALEYPPFSAESSGLAPATSAHYSDFSLYSNHEPCFNPSTTPSSLFY